MKRDGSVTFTQAKPTPRPSSLKQRNRVDLAKKAAQTRLKLAANSALFATSLEAAAKGSLRGRAQSNWRLAMAAEEEKSRAAAKFKPWQAIYTFLIELLPPYLVSPLLIFLVHGWEKGWRVCGHRRVLPFYDYQNMTNSRTKSGWIAFHIRSLFVTALGPWTYSFVTVFFFMNRKLLYDNGFELAEYLIFISFFVVRASVIAIKYGYYSEEDLRNIEHGVSTGKWNVQSSDKKMLLAGWCGIPRLLPGVIQDCINDAQVAVEVDLKKVSFKLSSQDSLAWNADSKMDTGDCDKVSALHVFSRVVTSTFGESIFNRKRYVRGCVVGVWSLAWTAPALKACFGLPIFGNCWQSKLIGGLILFNEMIFGTLTLLLLACTAHDFHRRCNATRMLSKLMTLPGMPEEEFYANLGPSDQDVEVPTDVLLKEWKKRSETSDPAIDLSSLAVQMTNVAVDVSNTSLESDSESCSNRYIHFDIRDPENAFAWMLTRRTLRKCGAAYFRRGILFQANYMLAGILGVVIANSYIWTETPHYIFGEVGLIVYFLVLTFTFVASAHFASTLQESVGDDRLMLKRDIFLIEKEIIDVRSEMHDLKENSNPEEEELGLEELEGYCQILESSKTFIRSSEALVAYEEEEHDPIIVLGFKADSVIVSSILSLCLGSLWLIYEGYSNTDFKYNGEGLFTIESEG